MIPNQGIYGFRGSDLTILEDYEKNHNPQVLHLTENHRSTPQIVEISNNLIVNNFNKFNLPLLSTLPSGKDFIYKKTPLQIDEANYVAYQIKKMVDSKEYTYGDFMIIYRQNQSKGIFDAILNKYMIPHYAYGIGFLEYREIKYILGYCRLILNHNDNEAFTTVCNFPPRGIADVLLSKIRLKSTVVKKSYYETAKLLNDNKLNEFISIIDNLTNIYNTQSLLDFFDEVAKVVDIKKLTKEFYDLKRRKNNVATLRGMLEKGIEDGKTLKEFLNELALKPKYDDLNDVVKLMTIHQAKGLEARVVFIVEARNELMPGNKKGLEIEEERRVFYVGVTRAKELLYIILSEKNRVKDLHRNIPSKFIGELNKNDSSVVVEK